MEKKGKKVSVQPADPNLPTYQRAPQTCKACGSKDHIRSNRNCPNHPNNLPEGFKSAKSQIFSRENSNFSLIPSKDSQRRKRAKPANPDSDDNSIEESSNCMELSTPNDEKNSISVEEDDDFPDPARNSSSQKVATSVCYQLRSNSGKGSSDSMVMDLADP